MVVEVEGRACKGIRGGYSLIRGGGGGEEENEPEREEGG